MTPNGTHVSLHERRINAVVEVLQEDAQPPTSAAMSGDVARRLAARVLHALDQVPRTIRQPEHDGITTSEGVAQQADSIPVLDVLDVVTCPACPHALSAHDAIGTRFCRATIAHALPRRCTCPDR